MTVLPAALPICVALTVFAAVVATWPVVPVRLPLRTGTTLSSAWYRALAVIRSRHATRSRTEQIADDLPDVVDLLHAAATAGSNVRLAIEAARRHRSGPVGTFLAEVLATVRAGERLGDALADAVAREPPNARLALQPLVAVLVDSDRYGTALGPALDRLAADLRVHRQRRAETRARRVPVRLLVPLVVCVLPSFALLTVAPLLAGVARDALADTPSVPLESQKEFP